MRIADNMTFEQVRKNVSKNRAEMSDLQNKAATQKRVTKPSDDPLAAARTLRSRVEIQGNDQYQKNLNYAQGFLELTDQTLDELTQYLVRAKELLLSQVNDASANAQSRRVVATEVEQLYNQIVQIGNRKLGDRFIFSGFKTTEPPFDPTGRYNGDDGEMRVGIDQSAYVTMNLPGNSVFTGENPPEKNVKLSAQQPRTLEELKEKQHIHEHKKKNPPEPKSLDLRAPASLENNPNEIEDVKQGANLFTIVKNIEVGLKTNDKYALQSYIEDLDAAIDQVVLARATVGSRSMVLKSALESLQKAKVESQVQVSQLEDADIFKVVSDINKTESTLQASLQTSGKLMMPSLLDFLR